MKKILIVEDDEVFLQALYSLFRGEDYIIISTNNNQEALIMTERLKPNIVLLDLLPSKNNSFDYLQNMKLNAEIKNIPVIVLFNLEDKVNIEKAKKLGAEDYFIKSSANLPLLFDKVKEKTR